MHNGTCFSPVLWIIVVMHFKNTNNHDLKRDWQKLIF